MKTYKTKIAAARAFAKASGIVIEKGHVWGPSADGVAGQGCYIPVNGVVGLAHELWDHGYIYQSEYGWEVFLVPHEAGEIDVAYRIVAHISDPTDQASARTSCR
jgi:hypothetical protein